MKKKRLKVTRQEAKDSKVKKSHAPLEKERDDSKRAKREAAREFDKHHKTKNPPAWVTKQKKQEGKKKKSHSPQDTHSNLRNSSPYISTADIIRGRTPIEPTEHVIQLVGVLVAAGNYPNVACRAVGISDGLYKKWMAQGTADKEQDLFTPYSAFVAALDAVEAISECQSVQDIGGRLQNWQALAWVLERKAGKRWGQKLSHTVGGDADAAPIKTAETSTSISAEYGARVLAILEATVGLDALKSTKSTDEE